MTHNQRRLASALLLAPLAQTVFAARAHAAISLSNDSPKQGETIEVTVDKPSSKDDSEKSPSPSVTFNGHCYKLFQDAGESSKLETLLSIPADLKPGTYSLTVGNESKLIKALDCKFPLQYLRLPKSKDNFLMSPGEEEAVDGAKRTLSDQRLWTRHFVAPSKYRVSAAFGLKRVVNGKLLDDYFHSGLDYAASLGSPIVACGDGKVVLARTGFRLHGNIVAIDHGQGVISFYLHMQKILVRVGQLVKAGQKIGTVGQSGRATGPHLHFSIYVNQVAANPNVWFASAFTPPPQK